MKIAKIKVDGEALAFPSPNNGAASGRWTIARVCTYVCLCTVDGGKSSVDASYASWRATDWNYWRLIGDAGRNVTSSPTTRHLGREIKEMRLTSSMSCKPPEIPYRDGIAMARSYDDSIHFSQIMRLIVICDIYVFYLMGLGDGIEFLETIEYVFAFKYFFTKDL